MALAALALALPALAGPGGGHGNGQANGHGNGQANGHGNGQANGHGNGQANGHGNGQANGHGNGQANGHGNGQPSRHTPPASPPPHAEAAPQAQSAPRQQGGRKPEKVTAKQARKGGVEEPAQAEAPAPAPAYESAPVAQAPTSGSDRSASTPRRRVSLRSVGNRGNPKRRSAAERSRRESRSPQREQRPSERRSTGTRPIFATQPAAARGARAPVLTSAAASRVAAAPLASSGPNAAERRPRVTVLAPPDPLPARVLPQPVKNIVEVVPDELWAALAGLLLLASGLAAWSWMVALRARRLQRQRVALLAEIGLLQAALLPPVPSNVPVTVAYRPADGAAAGGDFYDAFTLPGGRTGLVIGDVLGHGRDALARTTLIRYTLRAHLEAGLEPRQVVRVAGAALGGQLDAGFATVTVAVHDTASGRFTFASAGHHPPIVIGPAAHEPVTACSAPPLGIGEATGFRQSTFTLTAGSTVCLYTDGLTESRVGDTMLGRDRLAELLEAMPAGADGQHLLDRVAAVARETPDDMAVCLVRAPEGAPEDGTRIEELAVDEAEVGQSLEHFLRACGVSIAEVPGMLREAGEATRREGTAIVRVRLSDFRPDVDIVPGNVVHLSERRLAAGA